MYDFKSKVALVTGAARKRGIGWRLDYFLVSEGLVDQVQDVIIHDEVPGSDHCPVTLLINDQACI